MDLVAMALLIFSTVRLQPAVPDVEEQISSFNTGRKVHGDRPRSDRRKVSPNTADEVPSVEPVVAATPPRNTNNNNNTGG